MDEIYIIKIQNKLKGVCFDDAIPTFLTRDHWHLGRDQKKKKLNEIVCCHYLRNHINIVFFAWSQTFWRLVTSPETFPELFAVEKDLSSIYEIAKAVSIFVSIKG